MTIYYCQSWGDRGRSNRFHNEFHEFLFKTKPAADALAYISNVVMTEQIISGADEIRDEMPVNTSKVVSIADRNDLVRLFELGQISYSDMPLGACLTRRKCSKRSMIQLTGCIGCNSSLVNLNKLNRAIGIQEQLIQNVSRNNTDDFIYRSENSELQGLLKLRESILEKNK